MVQAPSPQPTEKAVLAAMDRRYRAPLLSFFRRRVSTAAEAEDLTQEVFLRVLACRTTAPEAMADAFIFRIATNLLHDRSRRARSRSGDAHLSLDDKLFTVDSTREPSLVEGIGAERVIAGKESLAEVLAVLDSLPRRTKDMFLLYRLEGMKKREIAALYGVSVSAVEKQIVKALRQLANI